MEHDVIPLGERHGPHNFEYADATERGAATVTDVKWLHALALQLDEGSYWRLAGVAPAVWQAAGLKGDTGPKGDTGLTGPKGDTGDAGAPGADGTSVALKGSVATVGDLPGGAANGDLYVVLADGHGYVWGGASWSDVGPIQGPKGDTGLTGPKGDTGDTGPKGDTGAAGTPGAKGDTGDTGPKGDTGAPGADGMPGATTWAGLTGTPTTLAGYGISDATPSSHVGEGGTAHANAVASGAAGFMTGSDKAKLDGVSGTNTGDQSSVTGNAGTATKLATARNIDGVAFDGSAAITVIAPATHAATSKATPVDADSIPLVDSAASNVLKKLTWANLKATLKTYFDTLYATLAGNTFTGAQIYGDQVLSRGMTKDMGMVFLDKGNSGTSAQTLDYTAGSHQKLTVTGAFTMNAVTGWPPSGNTGELLLELVNGASNAITWTMAGTTQRWWKRDGTEVATYAASGYALKAAGTDWILMWSTDAGATTNFKVQ